MNNGDYLRRITTEDVGELEASLARRVSVEGLTEDNENKRRRIIGLVGAPFFCVLECNLTGSCVATRGVDAKDKLADGKLISRSGRTWHDHFLYLDARVPLDRAPMEAEDCAQNYIRAIDNGNDPTARDFRL